ncbi:phage baseplate assembly protein [Xanthobacter sp. KR7-225]|uniref:phage baseplate assembly protein n=1 Tax=Xanthobacter sp. KR7-225 TaxID=3156613 RepID=UPI0032B590D1
MSIRELAYALRGLITRGVVGKTDDTAETQVVDVTGRHGAKLTRIEVAQPYGFASNAPAGGLVLLLAVGGDAGDVVALPVGAPSSRMGKLAPGEVALYGLDGSRVHVKADGSIDIVSSKAVTARVPGVGAVEIAESFVRGRMESGEKFAATAGVAKIAAGGHYLAATSAGPRASAAIVIVPAEPAPDV